MRRDASSAKVYISRRNENRRRNERIARQVAGTRSLAIFSRGSQLLAEANTIQKAKDLKDLALTAADWARRKGMGEEAVQYARSYALDAERKMGQMLIEAPKAKGAKGNPGGRGAPIVRSQGVTTQPPTLHALGLTKRDSSQAQKLARLPEEKFQAVKAGTMRLHKVDKPHVSSRLRARPARPDRPEPRPIEPPFPANPPEPPEGSEHFSAVPLTAPRIEQDTHAMLVFFNVRGFCGNIGKLKRLLKPIQAY